VAVTDGQSWRLADLTFVPAGDRTERATINGVEVIRENGRYWIMTLHDPQWFDIDEREGRSSLELSILEKTAAAGAVESVKKSSPILQDGDAPRAKVAAPRAAARAASHDPTRQLINKATSETLATPFARSLEDKVKCVVVEKCKKHLNLAYPEKFQYEQCWKG
jgi:hypothetical protein